MSIPLISRRAALLGAAAAGFAQALNLPAYAGDSEGSVCSVAPSGQPLVAKAERAVSLRALSAAMQSGGQADLHGMTRLEGYIADSDNKDIIVWGLAESDQPPLHVEDFVVALRAAHGRYGERRDGVNYITTPLVSIDPDPVVSGKLKRIQLFSPNAQSQFDELCKSPQKVRIEGMPRDTRLANVLIEADYRMKMVGQGTVKLPIDNPFPSAQEERVRKARDMTVGKESTNTRFWFQPGRFAYQADGQADTVFVDTAQVILNDEDQVLSRGALVASGKTDEISRAFVCAWTARMEDIYKSEPIWRDMHNVFRHFAVSRIMKDRDAFQQVNFDGDFLLDRYVIPKVTLPQTLPGLGHIERYETREGTKIIKGANTICGGVAVGFNKALDENAVKRETVDSGRSVVASRPNPQTVSWVVGANSSSQAQRPSGAARPREPSQSIFRDNRPGSVRPL